MSHASPLPTRPSALLRVVLLAVVAAVLAGCQVRVATGVDVAADGSGRLEVLVALDEELTTSLDADGIEPFEGLVDLGDGWEVATETIDGGDALRVSTDFDDPTELTDRVDQLSAGLDEDDPAVLEDVRLEVDADGSARFAARAGLRPPASTGIDAAGIAPDGEALRELLAERGDELVLVELRLTLPGPVEEATGGPGSSVDGRTVTWTLPPTGLVDVAASAGPPSDRTLVYAIGAGVLALVLAAAVAALRR